MDSMVRASSSAKQHHSAPLRASLCLLLVVVPYALAQDPIRIQYDAGTTGPDGPWNTLNISTGVPDHFMPMIPSLSFTSLVVNAEACSNAPDNKPCQEPLLTLWQYTEAYSNAGGTDQESGAMDASSRGGLLADYLRMEGEAVQMPQRMTLYDYGGDNTAFVLYAYEHAMTRSESFTVNFPGGAGYTMSTGFFSLYGYGPEAQWTASDDTTESRNRTMRDAYERDYIPSISYGMHVGSAALGMGGSLVLGGYDSSRFLTDPIAVTGTKMDNVELLDIAINVSSGGSAYTNLPSGFESGLLRDTNGTAPGSMDILPNPGAPYLYLPQATCDAIAAYLPVTYDAGLNIYLWNTSSDAFDSIVTSPHYLSLTFSQGDSDSNSTIKVPFALLNLTLEAPLVSEPTQYFPCSPWDADSTGRPYSLGRAFLQATSMAQNWQQRILWLSQAPGPDYEDENIKTIDSEPTTLEIDTELPSWEDSWAGTLKALSATGESSNSGTSSAASGDDDGEDGLSGGAIAGIVVGVVVVILGILAFFLWRFLRRRKARKQGGETGEADNGLMSGPPQKDHYAAHYGEPSQAPVEKHSETVFHEADGGAAVAEMSQDADPVELPGDEGRVHEMKTVSAEEAHGREPR